MAELRGHEEVAAGSRPLVAQHADGLKDRREIERVGDCVILKQAAYIKKLVANYLADGVVPPSHQASKTPADDSLTQLVADALCQDAADIDPVLLKKYQSLVGALLYCAVNTRPDVAVSVGYLCRAMGKPTPELYEAAQRVLFYLGRHGEIGLCYRGDDAPCSGMTDSDWGVKHSTSGFVFKLSQAAISWASKRQPSVALSSCEAELMAASEAAKEAALTNVGRGAGVGVSRILNWLLARVTQRGGEGS